MDIVETDNMMDKHANIVGKMLTEKFLEGGISKMIVDDIIESEYQAIIDEYYGNWYMISSWSKLTTGFIERFKDDLKWDNVSRNNSLTEEMIVLYQHLVDWDIIVKHQKLSEDFIEEFHNKFSWSDIVIYQQHIDFGFMPDKKIDTTYVIDQCIFQNLMTEEMFLKYKDFTDWEYIFSDYNIIFTENVDTIMVGEDDYYPHFSDEEDDLGMEIMAVTIYIPKKYESDNCFK